MRKKEKESENVETKKIDAEVRMLIQLGLGEHSKFFISVVFFRIYGNPLVSENHKMVPDLKIAKSFLYVSQQT